MADYTGIYNWGRPVGIQVKYRVLEDSTKDATTSTTDDFVSGRPVILNTAGRVIPINANVAPYGLSRATRNTYVDEIGGGDGYYGSGKVSVIKRGIVIVKDKLVFTDANGVENDVRVLDHRCDGKWAVGDAVYANLVTTDTQDYQCLTRTASGTPANVTTWMGTVTAVNSTVGEIEIDLRC